MSMLKGVCKVRLGNAKAGVYSSLATVGETSASVTGFTSVHVYYFPACAITCLTLLI